MQFLREVICEQACLNVTRAHEARTRTARLILARHFKQSILVSQRIELPRLQRILERSRSKSARKMGPSTGDAKPAAFSGAKALDRGAVVPELEPPGIG